MTILLDTSTSMMQLLPTALGVVREVTRRLATPSLRLVQAGDYVTRDEELEARALDRVRVVSPIDEEVFVFNETCEKCQRRHAAIPRDARPTDLSAAFAHLDASGEHTPLLVVTDGRVRPPHRAPQREVIWAVMGNDAAFSPRWGRVERVNVPASNA